MSHKFVVGVVRVVWACVRLIVWIVVTVVRCAGWLFQVFGAMTGSPLAIVLLGCRSNDRARARVRAYARARSR